MRIRKRIRILFIFACHLKIDADPEVSYNNKLTVSCYLKHAGEDENIARGQDKGILHGIMHHCHRPVLGIEDTGIKYTVDPG